MTGKEAFQEAIEFCDYMHRMVDLQQRKKDSITIGKLKGIEIIKAGLVRKRDKEEAKENVQS